MNLLQVTQSIIDCLTCSIATDAIKPSEINAYVKKVLPSIQDGNIKQYFFITFLDNIVAGDSACAVSPTHGIVRHTFSCALCYPSLLTGRL